MGTETANAQGHFTVLANNEKYVENFLLNDNHLKAILTLFATLLNCACYTFQLQVCTFGSMQKSALC